MRIWSSASRALTGSVRLNLPEAATQVERRDRSQNFVHAAQAVRALLEEERAVGLADAHEAGVGRELDDDLAHPGDGVGRRADRRMRAERGRDELRSSLNDR